MRRWFCICILAAFIGACEQKPAPTAGPSPTSQPAGATAAKPAKARLRIAVIPKGTTHDFWKAVHAGAIKAQREAGDVEVVFRGPEREDDREQQISLVQNFISSRVDAIVLAPLDNKALLAPVQQATAAKIPVVIIDSSHSSPAPVAARRCGRSAAGSRATPTACRSAAATRRSRSIR